MQQAAPTQLVPLRHDRSSNRAGAALTELIAVRATTTAKKEKRMFGIGIDAKVMWDWSKGLLNDFGTVG
jgi:hypothetical protein